MILKLFKYMQSVRNILPVKVAEQNLTFAQNL